MERARRDRFATTAVPSTWQVPVTVAVVVGFLIALTPLAIQGLAGWVTSGQFTWPTGHLPDAYLGLLGGDFGQGLPPEPATALPKDAVMWTLTSVGEVFVLLLSALVGLRVRDITGSSSDHGLATARQAQQALGLFRLHGATAVIRPDLYPRASRTARRRDRGPGTPGAEGRF